MANVSVNGEETSGSGSPLAAPPQVGSPLSHHLLAQQTWLTTGVPRPEWAEEFSRGRGDTGPDPGRDRPPPKLRRDVPPNLARLRLEAAYPLFYIQLYSDILDMFGPSKYWGALDHYQKHGAFEGRSASPFFSPTFYLSYYPQLARVIGRDNYPGALYHWVNHGISEGRRGSAVFDLGYYLRYHGDLVQAFGADNYAAAWAHWITVGHNEGRRTNDSGLQLEFRNDFYAVSSNSKVVYTPPTQLTDADRRANLDHPG